MTIRHQAHDGRIGMEIFNDTVINQKTPFLQATGLYPGWKGLRSLALQYISET
jgi:hypothetical protein